MAASKGKVRKVGYGVVAGMAVLASACGGGGGATTSRPANNPPAGSAAITTDNAVTVVRTASEAMMSLHMLAGAGGGMVSDAASGKSTMPRVMVADVGLDTIRQLSDLQNDPLVTLAAMQVEPFATVALPTVNCPNGGTISRSLNDVNNDNKVNSGDSVTFTFNSCLRGTTTRTGSVTLSKFNLTGDPVTNPTVPWQFTGELTLKDVASTGAMGNMTANGTLALTWKVGTQMMDEASVTTVGQLTVVEGAETFTFSDTTLTMRMDMTTSVMSTAMATQAKVKVSTLGDMVINTTKAMVMKQGEMQPSDGAVTVTLGRSRVTATTQAASVVQLQVDPNGDGSVVNTISSSWDEIHSMPMGPGGPGGTGGAGTMPGMRPGA